MMAAQWLCHVVHCYDGSAVAVILYIVTMVAQRLCHVVHSHDGNAVVVSCCTLLCWQRSGYVMLYIVMMAAQWLCHVVHCYNMTLL